MSWPIAIATLSFLVGFCLILGGTYLLAGAGWSMVVAAGPPLALCAVIVRGLRAAE